MSKPTLSFEFFPPRDEDGRERLVTNVADKLQGLNPKYFSVTYGAGGSTRDGTRQTVAELLAAGHHAVPHLSMGGSDVTSLKTLLDEYQALGVTNIVALRGDQPSGMGASRFDFNAEALIRLIRSHSGSAFDLIVAAYPEVHPDASSAASDLDFFARKVDAGANIAITQYFYNIEAYEDFVNRCVQRGINIPIIPGVMPITNYESIVRFSERAGAEIPRWLNYALRDRADDPEALNAFGVEYVTSLCEKLIALGVPSFHFYTLNRWGSTTRICQNLGLA